MRKTFLVGLALGIGGAFVATSRRSKLPKRVPGKAKADLERHWDAQLLTPAQEAAWDLWVLQALTQAAQDDSEAIERAKAAGRAVWYEHHGRELEQRLGRRFVKRFDRIAGESS